MLFSTNFEPLGSAYRDAVVDFSNIPRMPFSMLVIFPFSGMIVIVGEEGGFQSNHDCCEILG